MSRLLLTLLLGVAITMALPTPPLIRQYGGICGPGQLSCSFTLAAADLPKDHTMYINSVSTHPHSLQVDQTTPPFHTTSYVVNNHTHQEQWSAGIAVPYCAIKAAATSGVTFSIGCLRFVPGVIPEYRGCEAGSSFAYNITLVLRSPSIGVAGIDQPAVAELPWVAGDQIVAYSLVVRTPTILPTGGWSMIVTANRVDWNEEDLIVGIKGKADNSIGLSVRPYTADMAAQCVPVVDKLPVPLRRMIAGGVAVSVNNGFIDNGAYGGFSLIADTEYEIIYYAPYTTQALVITASLAPHAVAGSGNNNLIYSGGSMAAGVILSLLFGGAIGAGALYYAKIRRAGFSSMNN